jgi:hypothetical protein
MTRMPPAPLSHRLRTAGLLVAFWTGLGVLFALPGLNEVGRFRLQLSDAIAQWWAWGLVSLVIVAVDRRLPFGDKQIGLRVRRTCRSASRSRSPTCTSRPASGRRWASARGRRCGHASSW